MDIALLLLTAVLTLAAAVYAQSRIPYHSPSLRHALIARLILALVGLAFGAAMVATYTDAQGWPAVLVFLGSFGLVHVPAALILFLKRQRNRDLRRPV